MGCDEREYDVETSSRGDDRSDLRADCTRCVGLCCVALPFAASADFGHDKPAGEPCRHLSVESSCGLHDRLRSEGYRGCAVFDCFGAGQQVTQVTFGGADWRDGPETAGRMFAAFGVMRPLHELLWYLTEAEARLRSDATTEEGDRLREELAGLREEVRRATRTDADQLGTVDVTAYHRAADPLLLRVSELERAGVVARREHRGADLAGADLRGADLRAAGLRSALLISADLRGADLRGADVLGADLRDADLAGADLTGCLFLTRPQVESARGDAATRLPEGFDRPAHWA